MVNRESDIYVELSRYMDLKYPKLIIRFDHAAGLFMKSKNQIRLNKKVNSLKGYPDFFLAYPVGKYCGLFLEIKRVGHSPFLIKGGLSANEHVQEQNEVLKRLESFGFKAVFAVGFDGCVDEIEKYLKQSL